MIKSSARWGNESQFLAANTLIRQGTVFNVKVENDPIPPGDYVYSAEREIFREIHSGYEARGTDFINGRNNIQVVLKDELESASVGRIKKLLNRETVVGVKAGVKTFVETRRLNANESALLESTARNQQHSQGNLLNKVLNQSNTITTRKALSFDFESLVDRSTNKINPEKVFSSGIAESIDVTYDPGDAMSAAGGKTKLRRQTFKSTTYFDVDKVSSLLKAHMSGTIDDSAMFGKQNLALALEHLSQYTAGMTSEKGKGFQAKRDLLLRESVDGGESEIINMQNTLRDGSEIQTIEKAMRLKGAKKQEMLNSLIKRQLDRFGTSSSNGAQNALNILGSISNKMEASNLAYGEEASEHMHGHGIKGEYNVGTIEYFGKRPGTGKAVFTKDVLLSTVEGLIETSKRGNYDRLLTFGSAERDVLTQWGGALKEQLEALAISNPKDEVRKGRLLSASKDLEEVTSKITDVKALSEQVFDGFLPEMRKHLTNNADGVRNVVEKLFGYENTHRVKTWGVENFLQEKHSGFSLENLYSIFKDKNYQEWHTGAKDSADLGHFHMYLQDLVNKQGSSYRSETAHNMPGPGLSRLESNEFELFDVSNRLARNIQSRTILSEVLRDKSREDMMGLLNKVRGNSSDSSRHIINDETMHYFTTLGDDDFKSEAMTRLQSLVNSEIKKTATDVNSKLSTFKYRAPEPGLLSRAISSSSLAKTLALGSFVYFSSLKSAEDPGASIETGEHNSLETVARRIATTPFNSNTSTTTVGFFARQMAKRMTGSIATKAEGVALREVLLNTFIDDRVSTTMQRTALTEAAHSMEKRFIASDQRVLNIGSSFISKMRRSGSVIEERIYKQGSKNTDTFLKLTNMRDINNSRYSLDLSGRVNDQALTGGYSNHTGFFLGSTGPSTQQNIVGLNLPMATREQFLYGDPISFMKKNKALDMADSLTSLYSRNQTMTKPSFSNYWSGTSTGPQIDTGKLDIGHPLSLSTRADMPMMKDLSGSSGLSSAVVGRKQFKKMGKIISIGEGNTTSVPIDGKLYAGVIDNYRPDNSNPAIAYNTLNKVRRERPVMSTIGYTQPAQKSTAIPTMYVNSGGPMTYQPEIHYASNKKPSVVILDKTKRAVSSNYHDDANGMLQGSRNKYAPTAESVMDKQRKEAARY